MTTVFSRWLPCTTLFVWSAILLYCYFSGRVVDLLVPSFRPYVVIAGFVMLALAASFLFLPGVASCCDEDQCGHPLGRMTSGRILTFLVLLLPIGVAAMVSPDQFSANAIRNRGVITDAEGLGGRVPRDGLSVGNSGKSGGALAVEPPLPSKDGQPPAEAEEARAPITDFLPRNKDGHPIVQVIDLLYAAQDSSLRVDFQDVKIELVGQLMPDNESNASGRRFKLVRMFMNCCAADARPVAALVEAPKQPDAPELSWVRVVGTATFPLENGRTIAVVQADSVMPTDPPEETMLY